jgi:ABC-2 type transport system ATP-binding protein
MLQVKHLNKNFGEFKALSEINFEVRDEILGLIGPNGSGKTTLMESVAGLTPVQSGEIQWQGRPASIRERSRFIFYLPDGITPYEEDVVDRVLRFFAKTYGADDASVNSALNELGLKEVLSKRVGTLSKGFRKRLLLGLSLLANQPMLFLDEPFDGFDLRQTLGVIKLLKRLKRPLFLSIHQLGDAAKICDRLILINQGKIVAQGTLEELKALAKVSSTNLEEIFLALT